MHQNQIYICWVGINGEHTSHHGLSLWNLLSLSEVNLSRAAHGHLLPNDSPLDQARVGRRLRRLSKLVLGALTSIVAFLATLETSTRLVPLSLMRQNLLSLRLLHLLSRCTVLSGRYLVGLPRLTERLPTRRLIGHSPDNLYLLSMWVTRIPSNHLLTLPLSLRVTLKSLHGNGCIHQSTKSLVVPCV